MQNRQLRFSIAHRYLSLQCDGFLIIRINADRAECILSRFSTIAAFKKDPAQQDMRVDQLRVPENRESSKPQSPLPDRCGVD